MLVQYRRPSQPWVSGGTGSCGHLFSFRTICPRIWIVSFAIVLCSELGFHCWRPFNPLHNRDNAPWNLAPLGEDSPIIGLLPGPALIVGMLLAFRAQNDAFGTGRSGETRSAHHAFLGRFFRPDTFMLPCGWHSYAGLGPKFRNRRDHQL